MDTVTPTAETWAAPPTEELSAVLTAAADAARAAVVEFSGETVGEYLGVTFEDASAATHRFLADVPGYQGWQWAVVVAAFPGAEHATISEVVLVPGPTALLAPQWVPWDQRVKPGDLSPGDLLAPPAEDPRLVPGYLLSGDPAVDEVAGEIGLGRRQVLGPWGRADAAQRWHDGDHGPESAMARSTRRVCRDCGYLLPLAGTLGTMFGVCANEFAADGHVVDFTYGCGAHSDTPAPAGAGSPLYEPYDDGVLDVSATPQLSDDSDGSQMSATTVDDEVAETAVDVDQHEQLPDTEGADASRADGESAEESDAGLADTGLTDAPAASESADQDQPEPPPSDS